MLEHVMRFVIALLVPTAKKAHVTGMLRDLVGRFCRRALPPSCSTSREILWPLFTESLAFVSAVMTGNRARNLFFFQWRAVVQTAADKG